MMRRLAILPLLALLAGCDDPAGSPVCPAYIPPSLVIQVVDAATDQVLNAGATGTWVSGQFAGTLEHQTDFPGQNFVVYGPAGRYSLVVQHAGYQFWGRDDIRVTAGQCGPDTETVLVEMTPSGG